MKKIILFLFFLVIFCSSLMSTENALISSAPVLIIDTTSAHGTGSGNNNVMQAGDVGFIMQNPGNIGSIKEHAVSISYLPWLYETSYLAGNFAYAFSTVTMGFSFVSFHSGEFDHYLLDGTLAEDKLSLGEMLFMPGVGVTLKNNDKLTLFGGVSAKYLTTRIHTMRSSSFAFDMGFNGVYRPEGVKGDIIFGLAFQNLGLGPKFVEERSPLPFKLRLGAGFRFTGFKHSGVLTPLMEYIQDALSKLNTGLEYGYNDLLFIRVGFSLISGETIFSGFATGLGVKFSRIKFDYALKIVKEGDQSLVHVLSLGYSF
ncbi:MAG: PorV/PorQ family protein [Spirochaetes bacterium]|nr:PorV/PorQ family protein [Spirochaetota bacterium]